MNQLLCDAIQKKLRIQFEYNNKVRIAEPQCYGIGAKGTELLRVYQLEGGSQAEPLFEVSKMASLKISDVHFQAPGPNYKRGDSAMKTIYCQL